MSKKKLAVMITSLVLVAVVGIGATLAYFTDRTDTKNNIVELGKVDIELEEETEDGDAVIGENGITFPNTLPGDVVSKKPFIQVDEQSADAYIRVALVVDLSEEFRKTGITADQILSWINIDESKWQKVYEDGKLYPMYYYQDNDGVAKPGERLDLFTEVKIPPELDNNAAKGKFSILVTAEAIQAEHVTPVIENGKIVGWPQVDIQKFEGNN